MEEERIKKEFFLKKIHKSKSKQFLFFMISMMLVLGIFLPLISYERNNFEVVEDDFSWVYQIDTMEETDGKLMIRGWAFELNQDTEFDSYEIILRDATTGKGFFPRMTYEIREDVNEYFKCEYDYSKSGFRTSISTEKLDLENNTYVVFLRSERSRKVYSTGIYYSNGKMMFVNSERFEPLETKGTDLETVTEEGVLRVYRPEEGMYIYQYEGALYWIAEPWYSFVDGDVTVQFQMDTTQTEKLPQERLVNHWNWSNISFKFSSKEITNWNTGNYRVAKCMLPTEYSITKIWTGNHVGEWLWRTDFRPWYEFD